MSSPAIRPKMSLLQAAIAARQKKQSSVQDSIPEPELEIEPQPVVNPLPTIKSDSRLIPFHFGSDRNSEWACLSNLFMTQFTEEGQTYHSTEQYYMASKARHVGSNLVLKAILSANNPAKCKQLGSKKNLPGLDPTSWDKVSYEIMKRAQLLKYRANPKLSAKLLSTGDAILVEASQSDLHWGCGIHLSNIYKTDPTKWPGKNLMGQCLMEVRAILRHELNSK
jgi:ribA/ribD-fused uncharacterized protein